MGKEDDPLNIFNQTVDGILMEQLISVDTMVRELSSDLQESELVAKLKEANSLVRLVCAGNLELYEEWRYRLIKAEKGKYVIIQGTEVNVESDIEHEISEE